MLRILFYHAGDTLGFDTSRQIYLGLAGLYLKTHIDANRPNIANQLHWCLPKQQKLSDDDLIALIEKEKPDLFCTGHYIWNNRFLLDQLARIRPLVSKDIIFVAGGPSVDVNINPNFFQENNFLDYAMYGAGEVAFADLVESIITNKKLIKFNTSNIAWYDKEKQQQVVAEFKYVPQSQISPFTTNEEMFTEMVKDIKQRKLNVILPYELTRGCPYKCTFCDWNSGLTNKTTRRKGTYQDELDLFQKLGIHSLYFADANVGQYEEDIDMVTYLAKKNIEEGAGFVTDGNFSKLRKDNNLKLYHLLAKSNAASEHSGFTISVQDTNKQVLENIDRPDVGWEVHSAMIRELRENYPTKPSVVQLIQGLPGQTVESWRETLHTVTKEEGVYFQIFVSELLSASPAARDPKYQENFKFTYSKADRWNGESVFKGTFAESCVSFTAQDFVDMTILSSFYTAILHFKAVSPAQVKFSIEGVVNEFIHSQEFNVLRSNLYDNWQNHNKFYYTIDFDGKPVETPLSGCLFRNTGGKWAWSIKFLKMLSRNITDGTSASDFIKLNLRMKNGRIELKLKNLDHYLEAQS